MSNPNTPTKKVYGRGQPIPYKLPADYEFKPKVKKQTDDEVLQGLDPSVYDEKCNVLDITMAKLPMEDTMKWFEKELYDKERAFDLLNDKLFRMVMDNYDSFVKGITQVSDLGLELAMCAVMSKNSRRLLRETKEEMLDRTITVVAHYKRRELLDQLLYIVLGMKQIVSISKRFDTAIRNNDYEIAIHICELYKDVLPHYKPIASMRDVVDSLEEKFLGLPDLLDGALKDICRAFSPTAYQQILRGFYVQNQPTRALEGIQKFFLDIINYNSRNAIYSYVLLNEKNSMNAEQLRQSRFKDLCGALYPEHFVSCLPTVLEVLCDIMYIQYSMHQWHTKVTEQTEESVREETTPVDTTSTDRVVATEVSAEKDATQPDTTQSSPNKESTDSASAPTAPSESLFSPKSVSRETESPTSSPPISPRPIPLDDAYKKYLDDIKTGLHKFRGNIWENIQSKVAMLLQSVNLTSLKIDEFIKMWDQINRFMEIGEEFSGTEAVNLKTAIKTQSKAYFQSYHKARMEDLSTMLENEMWAKCPVEKDFNVSYIYSKEFKNFYLPRMNYSADGKKDVFESFKSIGNPFSKEYREKLEQSHDTLKKSKQEEEHSQDIEESNGESKPAEDYDGPIMTTTAIAIIRWIGKYIHMMKVLPPIAHDIYVGVTQIAEYYMYSIYGFFGEQNFPENVAVPSKLKSHINRLRKLYGVPEVEKDTPTSKLDGIVQITKDLSSNITKSPSSPHHRGGETAPESGLRAPKLSSMVNINDPATLYGVANRAVAFESLLFIEEALKTIKDDLVASVPQITKEKYVTDFYNKTVGNMPEMVNYLWKLAGMKFINHEQMIQMIVGIKWDAKEISLEYSPYVDYLLKEFTNMSKKLAAEAKLTESIPKRIQNMIWDQAIRVTMEQLVEGYSRIKKLSPEAIGIMSLDLKVFQNGIEKQTTLRPIPMTQYVDNYTKAFYISTEPDFLKFVNNHPEYTLKQIMALINLGIGQNMKKQAKQGLISAVEDLDKNRKKASLSSSENTKA